MDVYNTKSVLGSQSRCSSHSIASVSPDHFLICFEATAKKEFLVSSS